MKAHQTLCIFPTIPCEFYASQWLTHTLPSWCYPLLYATTNVLNHLSYFLLLSTLTLLFLAKKKKFSPLGLLQMTNNKPMIN